MTRKFIQIRKGYKLEVFLNSDTGSYDAVISWGWKNRTEDEGYIKLEDAIEAVQNLYAAHV